HRKEFEQKVESDLKRYFESKFATWQKQTEKVIQVDMDRLRLEVEEEAGQILIELDKLLESFVGHPPNPDNDTAEKSKKIQALMAVLMLNPGGAMMIMGGKGDAGNFLKVFLRFFGAWIIAHMLFPPGALIFIMMVLAEAIFANKGLQDFQENALKDLG